LDDSNANRLLTTAVRNIQRDYPVHWTHFIRSAEDLVPHRTLHPVFAGSFDWHSCVHQTWLIVRLLRLRPDLPDALGAAKALDEALTAEGCATEAEFFRTEDGAYWERPYGWAWLMLLDAELRTWSDSQDTSRWTEALAPLAEVLRGRLLDWLGKAPRPVRVGSHPNTAFALTLMHDAAAAVQDEDLLDQVRTAAVRWYTADVRYGGFEPDAADFLSPALVEADLMSRVVEDFPAWLEAFLPDLDTPRWTVLREPIAVDDPTDPYGSHLAGLALSRSWGWQAVREALPADHRFAALAERAAAGHREVGWRYVFGQGYAAEHWLGTFATYLDLGALTG
jgi:hypothetical protein